MKHSRRRTLSRAVHAFAWLLLAIHCGSDAELGPPTGSTCPPNSSLTYVNFGKPFLDANCVGCHGPRAPALSDQASVKAARDSIDRMAAAGPNAINTAMPKDHGVSTDERVKLGEWLACGAP